jgi:hypothetical protein
MQQLSDLELTEKCAKWCGLKVQIARGSVFVLIDEEFEPFDPLNNKNDLWDIVVPKLPKDIEVSTQQGKYIIFKDGSSKGIKQGNLPDLSRAICTLIAEMEE